MSEFKGFNFNVKPNYLDLCQKTIRCYEELLTKMKDPMVIEGLKGETLIIFGKTRSGKSTFLLRLATDMNPNVFSDQMRETVKKDGVIMTFNGIQVASGHLAVTLVPNFYFLGKRLVIDLAGFDDLTPDRRPIISLLNYYLLSQISSVRILSVLSLEGLIGNEIDTSVRSYNKHYEELLTKDYVKTGIQSTIFLMTKIDKYGNSFLQDGKSNSIDDTIFNKVGKYALILTSKDENLGKTGSTIATSYLLVDYEVSKKELVDSLEEKLVRVDPMNAKLLRMDIGSVENDIVRQCASVTDSYYSIINEINDMLSSLNNDTIDLKSDYDDILNSINDLKSMLAEKVKCEHLLNDLDLMDGKLKVQLEGQNSKLESLNDDLIDVVEQKKGFEEKYQGFSVLEFTICHSIDLSDISKLYFEYETKDGVDTPTEIIIITKKEYQEKKSKIFECKDNQDVKKLRLTNLLEGDIKNVIKRGRLSSIFGSTENLFSPRRTNATLTLTTEYQIPHVAILMDMINIKKTQFLPLFLHHFEEKATKIKLSMLGVEKNIGEIETKLYENEKQQTKVRSGLDDIKMRFGRSREVTLQNLQLKSRSIANLNTSIMIECEKINELFNHPIINVTIQIGGILRQSNIGVSFLSNLENHKEVNKRMKETSSKVLNDCSMLVTKLDVAQDLIADIIW